VITLLVSRGSRANASSSLVINVVSDMVGWTEVEGAIVLASSILSSAG